MSVLAALIDAVGPEIVLSDPDLTRPFGTDWTGRWSTAPLAVLRPTRRDQVVDVVRTCATHGIPVVPQGGNTGLVGGSVPGRPGAVVLSLRGLTDVGEVDARGQVTVGAGTTIATLHDVAAGAGLTYGVDLASRDSATIGGTVATNAGGVRVVRFGDTRSQVVGVEAVLSDGTVASHLGGLPKDSAGYDVSRLLVGSEGTLAVVTAVRVQLRPPLPAGRVTTLVGVPTLAAALAVVDDAVASRDEVLAVEYMDTTGLQLVCDVAALPHPLRDRWPFYLLLETSGEPRLPSDLDAVVDRRLWEYRERQPEAMATLGVVHAVDVAVPHARLDELVGHLPHLVQPHRVYTFGHLAEGNLHIQIVGPDAQDDRAEVAVLQAVAACGGSISSEHGIGRAKAAHLALCRDDGTRRVMFDIKQALDPNWLLNPGVLVPIPD